MLLAFIVYYLSSCVNVFVENEKTRTWWEMFLFRVSKIRVTGLPT